LCISFTVLDDKNGALTAVKLSVFDLAFVAILNLSHEI